MCKPKTRSYTCVKLKKHKTTRVKKTKLGLHMCSHVEPCVSIILKNTFKKRFEVINLESFAFVCWKCVYISSNMTMDEKKAFQWSAGQKAGQRLNFSSLPHVKLVDITGQQDASSEANISDRSLSKSHHRPNFLHIFCSDLDRQGCTFQCWKYENGL